MAGGRAVERFEGYYSLATQLERRRLFLTGGRYRDGKRPSAQMKRVLGAVMRKLETRIEAGWAEVEQVRAEFPDTADLLQEHYLLGLGWADVVAEHPGMSIDKAKKAARRAFDWLDAQEEAA